MKFRSFALFISLFVICIAAVTATWFGVREFKTNLLKEEAVGEAIQWAEFIASRSKKIDQELASGNISQRTRSALDTAMGTGGIFRYKLFNSEGIIVHASRPKDLGEINVKPYFKNLIIKGKTFAKIETEEEFGEKIQVVSEAYVPLMKGGQFYGAIEVYVDETAKAAELDRLTQYIFWAVAALVLGVAFSWALFVGHDMRARIRLENELTSHRDHLQELVESATDELKTKASELEKALGKEKELNELQRQFVSMASHEFRTPLTIIDGAAQRIKSRFEKNILSPEDAARRADKIRAAVRRMTRLMESTLTADRMQEGKIKIDVEPCNIGEIVTEVCLRQRELDTQHNILFVLSNLPDVIQADSGAVEQIFTNLLSNAVKYTREIPNVEVNAYREEPWVVISVRDWGLGIDKEDISKIGERFFRAKTSTGIVGTGIGLNLVKILVEMHDGMLSVESAKDEGSIFTVHLPIAGPLQSDQMVEKLSA